MPSLNNAKVHRGGRTARFLVLETGQVDLTSTAQSIRFHHFLNSKGGGQTEVALDVGPKDFPQVIEMMIKVDRQGTMSAIAAELLRQVDLQPVHDAKMAALARDSVRSAAQQKYNAAPHGDDDTERLILNSVTKLIKDIEADKQSASVGSCTLHVAQG